MKELKLFEAFSGLGAQAKAFERLDCFDTEVVGTSDLDKEVVVNYAAIHCGLTNEMIENYDAYPSKEEMVKQLTEKRLGYDFQKDKPYDWAKLSKKKDKTKGIEKYWLADHLSKNFGDITQIKSLPETDLLFYSFPCTDISIAGRKEGLTWTCLECGTEYNPTEYSIEDMYECPFCGSHNIKSTRSGLLFEIERLLVDYKERNCLPSYLMLENVAQLVRKGNIEDFENWLQRLDNLGYNTYWKVLNSKDTGVPHSRQRCFAVSIRKDIDTGKFTFPEPFDSGIRLKDILEKDSEITDKYFLSDEVQARFKVTNPKFDTNIIGTTKPEFRTIGERDVVYQEDSIMGCLMATDYKQPKQVLVDTNQIDHIGILDCKGWGNVDKDVITDQGIAPALQTHNRHNIIETENKPIQSATLMGKYEKMMDISRRVYDEEGISPTLHCSGGGNTETKVSRNNLKVIRKLTPKECFRLQDFDDQDYENCKALGMCDTQGYKAAGNSITVRCIELLGQHLYKAQYDENYECYDEKMVKYLNGIKNSESNNVVCLGNVSTNNSQGGMVYGIDGVSQTICAGTHGYGTGNIYDDREIYSAALRGRYKEDGSTEQHLEINSPDYSNCLTTVQKDTLVVELNKDVNPVLVGGIGEMKSNNGTQFYQQDRVYDADAIAMCHPAQIPGGSYKYLVDAK